MVKKFKLKKGDEVIVMTGKDKGKTGKILKMLPKQMKAIVSEINRVKKNQKPDNNQPGGIIDKEMPIHVSNLSFYDREQNKGIKVGFKIRNNKKGYYFFLVHNSEPEAVNELERNFTINENVIRFLTTKTDKVPAEPTPIMKTKIDRENSERSVQEVELNEKDNK